MAYGALILLIEVKWICFLESDGKFCVIFISNYIYTYCNLVKNGRS